MCGLRDGDLPRRRCVVGVVYSEGRRVVSQCTVVSTEGGLPDFDYVGFECQVHEIQTRRSNPLRNPLLQIESILEIDIFTPIVSAPPR